MRKEILGAFFIFAILAGSSEPSAAQASDCDQQCLVDAMDRFVDEITGNAAPALPISPSVEVRENARRVELEETAWSNVATVRSRITFADPITGNVVSRSGVELTDGRPGYISTRLKVLGGEILDVELNSDTSDRVVDSYVYDVEQRFADLLQFHRRQPAWGPAAEQRFPVIDPEAGIVFGVTLLLYDDGRQMYVSEIFRIVGGKIALVDNIGLMLDPPVETLGFTH